jgi:hypothetical protein
MILHTLLLISSLSFAADGSKYKGKTGRAAHESVNKSQDKNTDGGPPTPVTPTNGDKETDKDAAKPAEGTEEAKPVEKSDTTPEATTPKKANEKKKNKKKNKKKAEKKEDNTMLFVGGGVLGIGAVLALLLGRKKEE